MSFCKNPFPHEHGATEASASGSTELAEVSAESLTEDCAGY